MEGYSMGKYEPYLDNETERIAQEIMGTGRGAWSAVVRDACRTWKKENMSIEEIEQELRKRSEDKKIIDREEKELILKMKKLEKEGQMKTLSKKKLEEILSRVTEETGVNGKFLEKLQSCARPTIPTVREMMRRSGFAATKIFKAWDILHGVEKKIEVGVK
jgi:DNA-binding transcriptional MerR regulator